MKKTNIDNIFQMFSKNTPGCSVCVLKNEEIILEKCFGLADLKNRAQIKPNTAFRLASLTKPFTAMAIMILKEKSKLRFDDKISKFFFDFPAYGKNVTIRQLLTHSSGIPDHERILYKTIKKGEKPTIYDAFEILKAQDKLLFEPGNKFLYSNSGYVLLALVIEKVSGNKYSEFLIKNIFKPLSLINTYVMDETKPKINNKAVGYRKNKKDWEEYDYDPLNYIVGEDGIYSTPRDLAIWKNAWTTEILVGKTTLIEALTPQKLRDGRMNKCGFSWFFKNLKKDKITYHCGTWVGFNNIFLTSTNHKTTVIMLSNTTFYPSEKNKINVAMRILSTVV